MIKNIVLDMGNVLLDYNPQAAMDELEIPSDAQPIIMRELFGGNEWVQLDLGNINEDEAFAKICNRVPQKYHDALRKSIDGWDICMKPLDGALQFCEKVKAEGFGVYVLSNAHKSFYRYFPRYFSLAFFDGIVVSADIHVTKPDTKIYKHLLEKYNLCADECLFVDDRADNVEGAIQAGMQALLFKNDYENVYKKASDSF